MTKLTEPQKLYIVQRLACYESPSQIGKGLQEEFGVEVDRRQIHGYDPDHGDVAEKWRAIHTKTREEFITQTTTIAVAHKAFRMRQLERMYHRAMDGARPNMVLAASFLEQAAKEAGDWYTNTRILTGKNGGAIEASVNHSVTVQFVKAGEVRGRILERLNRLAQPVAEIGAAAVVGVVVDAAGRDEKLNPDRALT